MKKDASASRRSHALATRNPADEARSGKRLDKAAVAGTGPKLTSIELCAGAGGQALGIARAGFDHLALVEFDASCCSTLRANRPLWNVYHRDIAKFDGSRYRNRVDLLAAGLPCLPFTVAGKQEGELDERDMFPEALRLIEEIRPKAIMIENVAGFLAPRFEAYRQQLRSQLGRLGYDVVWRQFNASDFGISQARQRVFVVAMLKRYSAAFVWPEPAANAPPSVGEALYDLMAEKGWAGAKAWRSAAAGLAPTIVGGSKKHGGPDLGPTRTRQAWAKLGVNGKSVADAAPDKAFAGMPRLTVAMVARLQGFPDAWKFSGGKTAAYRQVGNALPPQLAQAVAKSIRKALMAKQPL
ncbi:DNA cytosine methyltransferase [Mesorhizobium sp. AR10]|uniref:DNA cytosine methyltransferase n=1 Tax=Mesorhizobium sp. AR10 TaxID=2865839 RepID=UPI00215E2B1B|nr:DNA cytosine methyltransferase [Mesorhizobium sp. AR10]UVK38768.1 DNA cytosine methyltransferase [Mesorhizobium sp. AR10]